VHAPSVRATPLGLKGEAHEHLLNGIKQFIGHGWAYSPADAPGLGWFFYAAGALDDRNPPPTGTSTGWRPTARPGTVSGSGCSSWIRRWGTVRSGLLAVPSIGITGPRSESPTPETA
jgi:hypothetical protein